MATRDAGARDRWTREALRFLARRDRSSAEVRRFLERRGADPEESRSVIQRLSEWGYLDDAAFAERWVRARLSRRPTGRRGLEAELLTRGLDRETVQHAVERAVGARSERELAELVLARRLPSGARSAARAKALLARHGFDEDVITGLVGSPDAGWQEPDRPDA